MDTVVTDDWSGVSDADILKEIRSLQGMQKLNPPTAQAWQSASKSLEYLFAIMQERYPAGTIGPTV